MKTPMIYSEWVDILNILKNRTNDEEVLEVMKKGTIEWQSGVAERLTKRLINIVNERMQYAIDKYQSVKYYDERGFIQSLLNLRKELKFLSEVLNIAIIPEKDREQYRDLVVNQANIIQNSLEESAKNDHSGKLLSIVKNHRVNNF
ncbi:MULTISPECIES: hypothetical protein [Megamonas]|jgi:hypothetical protein|uniref:hypothetical protein n=1 Tax=Megamonas TaxID=158846 RepID=UPI00241E07C8|nr:hypothetical protein [Megamonas funiformis]